MAKPHVLIILDGWGHSEQIEHNAITGANTPNWDRLLAKYPHTLVSGSGSCVGLPQGQMGNSEVGHLNLGAGRVVHQELSRINQDIESGVFFNNPILTAGIQQSINNNKAVHIMGLISSGGVHSHVDQICAAIEAAKKQGVKKLYVHAFLDGRDTAPQSALESLDKINANNANIVSIVGRFYAMDRDNRWERTEAAYDLLTSAQADYIYPNYQTALKAAYDRGETDEFVAPSLIAKNKNQAVKIEDGDTVVFMNFRADRARQLSRAFVCPETIGFTPKVKPNTNFMSLTEYAKDIPTKIIYPKILPKQTLGEYISQLSKKQLRIAETEKYAHVTFFFNGGQEKVFAGEDRILIPSPDVRTYDLQPEMSAPELTDKLCSAIESEKYDLIICNYANPDMVGHTGNYEATVQAIECIDQCLGRVFKSLDKSQGEVFITADHGNAECMYNPKTGQAHTAHTSELVPLVYRGRRAKFIINNGKLSDIAPSLLYLMGLDIPQEMTGRVLLTLLK